MSGAQQNVDPGEIGKFEALASRWWDPLGEFRPLHDLNPLRLAYIAQRSHLQGARVADIGCGGGILAEGLAAQGAETVGIDMGAAPLAVARLHQHESGVDVDYRQTTAEQLAADEAAQFDVVTCMEMLEHVPDPESVIRACATLVKPGGQVFFSTINRNLKSFLTALVGAEYIFQLLPRGTHEYAKLLRPSELCRWSRKAGLDINAVSGMHYNPVTHKVRLSDDVSVNYLVHASRPASR